MHERTAEVLSALDRSRDALSSAILRVPSTLRETAPAPGRWSAAQVVQHLAIVETRIVGVMQKIIGSAKASGLAAESSSESVWGELDWTRITDRSVPRAASEANTPAADSDFTHASVTLWQQRALIRTLLQEADGLALSTVVSAHPVMGELNMYQWALFVATHESRHAAQVSEIADELTRPNVATATSDPVRKLLRHTLATLAYRAAKAVRNPPHKFGKFRPGDTSRSAVEIVAHMGDLFDWALSMAKGKPEWHNSDPMKWAPETARFFAALTAFDAYLASDAPLHRPAEKLFQGPIADALTHTGQLAMMRRLADGALRGENFAKADIRIGNTGLDQPPSVAEFD